MPFQTIPHWIQYSAFMLAANAGMINAFGLISFLHQSVSHMTGNVSLFAIQLHQQHYSAALFLIVILLCYILGAGVSGMILSNSNFQLGRRYGIPLTLVTLLIVLTWLLTPYFDHYALLFACTAMGVQNAMVSHYRGAIIRTTHLSGVLTDLGLALGYTLRGLDADAQKVILHLLILFGFIIGSVIAAFSYPYLQLHTLLIPAGLSAVLSLLYWLLYFRHLHLQK